MSTEKEEVEVESTEKKTAKPAKRIPSHWLAIASFVAIFGVFVGFTLFMKYRGGDNSIVANAVSKEEISLFVSNMNPMQRKQLSENPEQRKVLLDEVRRLFAVANEGVREGIASDKSIRDELNSIEMTVYAGAYEEKLMEGKSPEEQQKDPISPERIKQFWSNPANNKAFEEFLNSKIAAAKAAQQIPEDFKLSDDQRESAKTDFARMNLSYADAKAKFASISSMPPAEAEKWKEMEALAKFRVKIEKAQLVASQYASKVLTKKLEVTPADVDAYMKAHPELADTGKKKQAAMEVVKKLEAGDDFAKLAGEFSEDPGSKDKGGLYENVKPGSMDPAFEKAALALEPGQFTKEPVETKFGYHIIKLENRRNGKDGLEYDVRHILIGTQIADPENPLAPPMPAKDFVEGKLKEEKQKKLLDEIVARNPVNLPSDFEVPKVTEDELKKALEQQQQMMPMGQPQQPAPQQ
ncbi:MAG: peptidylprolyl isomerase [Pyrinomonadaceae bacterium]